jgi:hypothetical protein
MARLGKLTASRMADAIATTKSGFAASRDNLMTEYLLERLTGVPTENFTNAYMQWGIEREPEAREAYALSTFATIEQVGFVDHPTIGNFGCSPDGLVEDEGMIQIKCPSTKVHVSTLLGSPISSNYLTQIQVEMACTGRKWSDYVSYDPRVPEPMRLFVKRIHRDDILITKLEKQAIVFLQELDEMLEALKSKFGVAA